MLCSAVIITMIVRAFIVHMASDGQGWGVVRDGNGNGQQVSSCGYLVHYPGGTRNVGYLYSDLRKFTVRSTYYVINTYNDDEDESPYLALTPSQEIPLHELEEIRRCNCTCI